MKESLEKAGVDTSGMQFSGQGLNPEMMEENGLQPPRSLTATLAATHATTLATTLAVTLAATLTY